MQDQLSIQLRTGAIRRECERAGISRDELARQMRVATTTTYRVEHGHTEPSPRFIAALMRQTGLPFEDLFVISDDEQVPA